MYVRRFAVQSLATLHRSFFSTGLMDIFTSGIIARALRSANAPVSFAKAKGDGVCVASISVVISVLDASTFFDEFAESKDESVECT